MMIHELDPSPLNTRSKSQIIDRIDGMIAAMDEEMIAKTIEDPITGSVMIGDLGMIEDMRTSLINDRGGHILRSRRRRWRSALSLDEPCPRRWRAQTLYITESLETNQWWALEHTERFSRQYTFSRRRK